MSIQVNVNKDVDIIQILIGEAIALFSLLVDNGCYKNSKYMMVLVFRPTLQWISVNMTDRKINIPMSRND